jgi:hypothetical protein
MLLFLKPTILLQPAPDDWQPEKVTPNALIQKMDALYAFNSQRSGAREDTVAALLVEQRDGAWLLTEHGTLLLARVEKDPVQPAGIKVIWRRVCQKPVVGAAR